MAAEIFITFGSISVLLAAIGIALMIGSYFVGEVEDRKSEKAYKEWVEKYGVSGRGSPSPSKQVEESTGFFKELSRDFDKAISDFVNGPERRRACQSSNEFARRALDCGETDAVWKIKRTIKNVEDHLEAGRIAVESKGGSFEVEADVSSRLESLKSRLSALEKEERAKIEEEAKRNWEELEKRRKEDEARKAEARSRKAAEEAARREAEKKQLLLDRAEALRKQQALKREQALKEQQAQKTRQVDSLEPPEDPREFELYCADLLVKCGYDAARATKQSCDQGIDVIAVKDGVRYGIQCKRYSADVGNKAVQEVYAGRTFYNCHVAVVMTNSGFTKSATELAEQLGVVLWDGKHLSKLAKAAKGPESAEGKPAKTRKKTSAGKGSTKVRGDIARLAANAGLEVVDKRDTGGCLWVIGGPGIEESLQTLGDEALGFTYKPGGGKATGGRDAWWAK